MRFSLLRTPRPSHRMVAASRAFLTAGLVGMLLFSLYGTVAPSTVRCGLPGAVGCPGGILGTAVLPRSAGEQWFTVTMYDWGFWIVDASSGANETNAWDVFEGWTVHVNATSLPADASVGGTAYHGLGVEINATGAQLLSLAAPVGKWTQGSFVAPNAVYHHQHIWCTIECGPGHSGQQAWVLNIVPALPSPKAVASANVTSGRVPLPVAFTGVASGGTPPLNTTWDFGDGSPEVYTASATHTYLLGGNYSARFLVTDSNGMSASASVDVLVNSSVPLTAIATASRTSAVVPFTSAFGLLIHGGAPPYSIAWTFGDGGSAGGSNVTSHLYAAVGLYAVVATVQDSAGATVRALASVSALPPQSYFPVSVAASPTSGNPSVLVQFNATPQGGVGPYSDLWVFGDGSTGSGRSVQHQYNQTGSYEVNVFVSDAAGGVGTAALNVPVTAASGGGGGGGDNAPSSAAASANLTVVPLTTPNNGGSPLWVNATASIEAGSGRGENISWKFGDGSTGTGPRVSHQFAAVGVYSVTITARDSAGNTGTNTTTVRVQPLGMTVEVNQSLGDSPFTVQAAPTVVGGTGRYGAVSWAWGDGTNSAGTLVNHTYPANLTGVVTLVATTTDSAGAQVSGSATLTVNPQLVVTVVPEIPSTSTAPVDVRFTVHVTGGSGGYEPLPLWSFGDGSSTRGGGPANHTYANLGSYRVTVETNDSLGTLASGSAWVNLSVAPPSAGKSNGPSPWSLTGVSDPNRAALILIGMVGASGLVLLRRRRAGKKGGGLSAKSSGATPKDVPAPNLRQGIRPKP